LDITGYIWVNDGNDGDVDGGDDDDGGGGGDDDDGYDDDDDDDDDDEPEGGVLPAACSLNSAW